MLSELHELQIDREIEIACDILEDLGWSRWLPIDPADGSVSLYVALALACGARESECDTESFQALVEAVPQPYELRFHLAWDAWADEFGMDVVFLNEWFENKGDLLERGRRLANEIRFFVST